MKHWPEGNACACQHADSEYVGSFIHEELVLGSTMPRKEKLDVYVFHTSYYGAEVCIRYGAEDSHYYSPGSMYQFIMTAGQLQHDVYKRALDLIREKGILRYEQKHREGK